MYTTNVCNKFSDSSNFAPPPGEEDKYVLTKVNLLINASINLKIHNF